MASKQRPPLKSNVNKPQPTTTASTDDTSSQSESTNNSLNVDTGDKELDQDNKEEDYLPLENQWNLYFDSENAKPTTVT